MKRRLFILAALLIILCPESYLYAQKIEQKQVGGESRRPAADFTLKDIYGKKVRLSDYRGKVVFMYFWNTKSPYSPRFIKMMLEFQLQYPKTLQCLCVAFDSAGSKTIKPASEELGILFPSLIGNREVLDKYEMNNMMGWAHIIPKEGKVFTMFSDRDDKTKEWIDRWLWIFMNE